MTCLSFRLWTPPKNTRTQIDPARLLPGRPENPGKETDNPCIFNSWRGDQEYDLLLLDTRAVGALLLVPVTKPCVWISQMPSQIDQIAARVAV